MLIRVEGSKGKTQDGFAKRLARARLGPGELGTPLWKSDVGATVCWPLSPSIEFRLEIEQAMKVVWVGTQFTPQVIVVRGPPDGGYYWAWKISYSEQYCELRTLGPVRMPLELALQRLYEEIEIFHHDWYLALMMRLLTRPSAAA